MREQRFEVPVRIGDEEIPHDRLRQPVGANRKPRDVSRQRPVAHGASPVEHVHVAQSRSGTGGSFQQLEAAAQIGKARFFRVRRSLDSRYPIGPHQSVLAECSDLGPLHHVDVESRRHDHRIETVQVFG